MVTFLRKWSLHCAVAGMMLVAHNASAEDSEGIIRISDKAPTSEVRGQSPHSVMPVSSEHVTYHNECPNCPQGDIFYEGEYCPHECVRGNCRLTNWAKQRYEIHRMRKQAKAHHLHNLVKEDLNAKAEWARCKFGYFVPSKNPPFGHYSMVYPVDPSYHDPRDGQVYGSAATGGPVSVPLAPVVHHTYNYGWGVPSSRLTPVLHPVGQAPAAVSPGMYPSAPIAR